MKTKRLIFVIAALWACLGTHAQNDVVVRSVKEVLSDLSARTNRRYDLNNEACALIKVQYPASGATFEGNVIGDVQFLHNEYWVYVSAGTKRLRVHLPSTPSITVEFIDYDIPRIESNITYVLEFSTPSKGIDAHFYLEAGYNTGTSGAELSLGSYVSGVNFELNYMIPMVSEQTIYWNNVSLPSEKASYKPTMILGGRIGYGISTKEAIRITPQIGLQFLKTEETVEVTASEHASGAYCSSLVLACKLQYMLSKNIGLSLTPEYASPIVKSEGFKALSEASSDIKKWNNGLGIRLAINIEY